MEFLYILMSFIQSGMSYNFKKYTASMIDSLNTPYDYGSIMHYDSKAFGGGRVTIRPKKSGVSDTVMTIKVKSWNGNILDFRKKQD